MDMSKLAMESKSSHDTLLDVLGYDQDTSYDRPVSVQIVSDTVHISLGGQFISNASGTNLQIQVRDDGVLFDCARSGIAFMLGVPVGSYIDNALQLIDPIEWSLGNISIPTNVHKWYLQQKLATADRAKYESKSRGMLINKGLPSKSYGNYLSLTTPIGAKLPITPYMSQINAGVPAAPATGASAQSISQL